MIQLSGFYFSLKAMVFAMKGQRPCLWDRVAIMTCPTSGAWPCFLCKQIGFHCRLQKRCSSRGRGGWVGGERFSNRPFGSGELCSECTQRNTRHTQQLPNWKGGLLHNHIPCMYIYLYVYTRDMYVDRYTCK